MGESALNQVVGWGYCHVHLIGIGLGYWEWGYWPRYFMDTKVSLAIQTGSSNHTGSSRSAVGKYSLSLKSTSGISGGVSWNIKCQQTPYGMASFLHVWTCVKCQ